LAAPREVFAGILEQIGLGVREEICKSPGIGQAARRLFQWGQLHYMWRGLHAGVRDRSKLDIGNLSFPFGFSCVACGLRSELELS
jgi:hypothetical protein